MRTVVSRFTVRVDADAARPPTVAELAALTEALCDFRATSDGDPGVPRWAVTVEVAALTIEGAADFGVGLVVDAANGVGMPPSDIASLQIRPTEPADPRA